MSDVTLYSTYLKHHSELCQHLMKTGAGTIHFHLNLIFQDSKCGIDTKLEKRLSEGLGMNPLDTAGFFNHTQISLITTTNMNCHFVHPYEGREKYNYFGKPP